MFTRLTRTRVAAMTAILCMGLTTGMIALSTGCATNANDYKDPDPAISAFTTGTMNGTTFTATTAGTPFNIAPGGSAWFRANFAAKDGKAIVTPGNIPVESNVPFQITNIATTTPYLLTVSSGSGKTTTATSTVTVLAVPANLTYSKEDATYYVGVQIAANTPTVAGATPMTYTVNKPLPAGLSLSATTGAITGTPQVVGAQDTYTITATNQVGSTTRDIKIAVAATPITLSASPNTTTVGQTAVLTWDANSVAGLFTAVTITASPADSTLTGPFTLAGTKNVAPAVTTSYTLSATPASGGPAVTKSVDITVGNAPVRFTSFTAAPTVVPMGGTSTLSWTNTGIPLVLTLDGANILGTSNAIVAPVRRQTYTLAGSNNIGGDTATVSVAAQGFDILAGVPSSQGTYDGKGVNIRFVSPAAMAKDSAGNIYWCDTYGHSVRMMTPDGQAKTIAGTPAVSGNTDTTLNQPRGILVTPDGNTLFVGDSSNYVIKKIVKNGSSYTMTKFSGVGTAGGADGSASTCSFGSPSGLAFDPSGNYILVADYARHAIRQVSVADGSTITYAGSLTGASGTANVSNAALSGATFKNVNGIAFNKAGTAFYVSDGGNFTIRMVTWNGPATSGSPTGSTYTVAGTPNVTGTTDGAPGNLSICYSMAVDANDNVYIADYTNGLVRKMVVSGTTGTLSTVAGSVKDLSKDGVGVAANFNKPQGALLVNGGSTLLISDVGGSGCIRSIDLATAAVTTPYGMYKNAGKTDGTGVAALFNAPIGVATDAQGNAYVADTSNHLIRKITPAGVTTTLAGTGVAGAVNGTGTAASFSSPQGIAVDATGNVYVADTGNKMIRMITPSGVVTTVATLANAPTGIVCDPKKVNRVFVTSLTAVIPVDGGTVGTPITATPAFNFTTSFSGIAADASGNLYVADRGNHAIRMIVNPVGTPAVYLAAGIIGTSGKLNGALGTNTLNTPTGVGIDPDGNIIFAESTNSMIRMANKNGDVSTVVANVFGATSSGAGAGPLPAAVHLPKALAVNANGDVLVTTLDSVMLLTAPAGK